MLRDFSKSDPRQLVVDATPSMYRYLWYSVHETQNLTFQVQRSTHQKTASLLARRTHHSLD